MKFKTLSALLLSTLLLGACGNNDTTMNSDSKTDGSVATTESKTVTIAGKEYETTDVRIKDFYAEYDALSQEEVNAVEQANSYITGQNFSKSGLIEQLSSEYGEGFPKETAEKAVNLLDKYDFIDWNEQALATGKRYYTEQNMSKDGVYEQLVSEYGDGYTPEQAQYAVDRLESDSNNNNSDGLDNEDLTSYMTEEEKQIYNDAVKETDGFFADWLKGTVNGDYDLQQLKEKGDIEAYREKKKDLVKEEIAYQSNLSNNADAMFGE